MRAAAILLPLCLSGCEKPPAPNSIVIAKACIYEQVPEGQKVSADKAREAVKKCANQFDDWSHGTMAASFKRPLKETDPEMMSAFGKHQAAMQDYWLTELSDEIEPSFQVHHHTWSKANAQNQ